MARTLIGSMTRVGVRRLIATSMLGEGDSKANSAVWVRLLCATFLRGATPDKANMEAAVAASALDWVIVGPAVLSDAAATGDVRTYSAATGAKAHKITRGDLAAFLVDPLTGDAHLRRAVTVANS